MARLRYCYSEALPFAAMVMVECTNVGLSTLYKAAVSKGLSYLVFMVYSYAISALLLLPLSYIFHRKTVLPPFTVGLLGKFFVLGFLGSIAQFLGYRGIAYSSPTLGSAMSNLTPATTFILAILFRMEKLSLRSLSSQAKIVGTMVSITGALVVILYSGPVLITMHATQKSPAVTISFDRSTVSSESNWIIGGVLLAASYVMVSIWYIYQAKVVKNYPAELVVVFFYNLFSCIVSIPLCLIMEPLSAWKVKPNVELISIIYSGIVGSGFGILVHTWGLHVKGPVYVALFRPLSIAIAAIMGVIFLGDNLYLGCVIGSIIISMGFYIVTWAKTKEEVGENLEEHVAESSSNSNVPLLKHLNVSTKQKIDGAY
ncbi:WAT1-related At5g40240-like [Olea europaea subsp. europaea]|uniref:WAT1-related protein n=1 Tax=Olea europaea subsp. europaea TaxID=158383 RepID=A0A8S0RRD7_OLEEU|nr:WAT1-related At5g40240-like [Olea europaea subsp. europaea]